MQNIGFLYAVIPLLGERKYTEKDKEEMLTRHLQMFNTHPYLSTPLIGSIVRMEEDRPDGADASSIVMVKQSLMGPYAAIGDTFFWGALRPCAGIVASGLAWIGWILAPVAFLLIFTPAHLFVRVKGFTEGYQRGKQGIEFVRKTDLPRMASRVRWLSLIVLGGFCVWLLPGENLIFAGTSRLLSVVTALVVILVCGFLVKRNVSQIYILYGAVILFLLYSARELLMWWK